MKKIVLKKLIMKGFKSYKKEKIYEFSTEDNIFAGGNAKGKTTVADAICWCFTGKLFEGKKNENNIINKNSKKAVVEISFLSEDGEHTITRSLTQSTSAIIKLDNKKISQKKLGDLICEDKFLMTFNPLSFLAKKPTEARNIITSITDGLVNDEMVMNSLTKAEQNHLKNVNVEDSSIIRKYISNYEEKLNIKNAILDKIKSELDDINNKLNSKTAINVKEQIKIKKEEINNYQKTISELEENLNKTNDNYLKMSNEISQQQFGALHDVELELIKLKSCEESIINEGKNLKNKEYSLKNHFELEKDIIKINSKIKNLNNENDIYREAINSIKKKYSLKEGSVCPLCKQKIDKEVILNLKKIEEHESKDFIEKGIKNKNQIEELKEQIKRISNDLKNIEQEEAENKKLFEKNKNIALNDLRKKLLDIQNKIKKYENKKIELNSEFKEKNKNLNMNIQKIKVQIKEIEEELFKNKNIITKKNQELKELELLENSMIFSENKKVKLNNEILEIKKEIDNLSMNIKENKLTLLAINNFKEAKINLIEKTISSNLDKVTFELEKINKESGEIKGCFIVKYDNKELSCCSFSEVIKAGIEIATMLRDSLGLEYPLFIDNSESILSVSTKGIQTIRTIVVDLDNIVKVDKKVLSNIIKLSANIINKEI